MFLIQVTTHLAGLAEGDRVHKPKVGNLAGLGQELGRVPEVHADLCVFNAENICKACSRKYCEPWPGTGTGPRSPR